MKRSNYETLKAWRERSVAKYQARPRKASETPQDSPQRARKAEADSYYRQQRDMRLVRAGGRCEYQVNPDMVTTRCTRSATQTHHVVRRSHKLDHGVENLLALCARCHAVIHANPGWAKMRGYIRTDWQQIDSNGG